LQRKINVVIGRVAVGEATNDDGYRLVVSESCG
jgi:hypothetical protein